MEKLTGVRLKAVPLWLEFFVLDGIMHGIRGGENHQLHLTANSMTYNGDMPTRYSNALVVKPLEDESTII